jgi:hypothetical protein
MDRDDLDRLVHGYFERALSPDEEDRLFALMRSNPAAADRFVELSEMESALVETLRAEEAAPPEVSSPGRDSKRRTRVLKPPAPRPVWPLLFAASLLLGFVALLVQSAGKSAPAETALRPGRPLPKPAPEAPAASIDVPVPTPRVQHRPPEPTPAPLPEPKSVLAETPVEPRTSLPKPEVKPEPAPIAKPAVTTEAEFSEIRVERVEGEVVDLAGAPVTAGRPMSSGQGLEVRGAKSLAVVAFSDGTRVELRPDTKLDRVLLGAEQRKFTLSRGLAAATVAKQPAKQSVVFQTPHAEVTVLGTKLLLEIGKESTRVEVQEGRVRCKRLPEGPSVEITAGRFAVAAKGAALVARPVPAVRSFQDGVLPTPDYAGTRDTWISSSEPNANFATGNQLRLLKTANSLTTLLRWDVASIAPGSRVLSAELTFWVTGRLQGNCKMYDLRLPWEESEATWKMAASGRSWRTLGAQNELDHGAKPVGLLAPATTGFYTVALNDLGVAVVQDWVNDKDKNFGILVAGPDVNEWNLDSRESATPERRPKLTVTYLSAK